MTFVEWLIKSTESNLERIRNYARESVPQSFTADELKSTISSDTNLSETDRESLLASLAIAGQSFDTQATDGAGGAGAAGGAGGGGGGTGPTEGAGAAGGSIANNLKLGFAALVVIAVFGSVVYLLYEAGGPALSSGQLGATRGFIAGMFGLGLFIVALIALGILAWQGNTDDAVRRFNSAKEIFTALVAVFGTILGFYFGANQSSDEPVQSPVEAGLIVGLSGIGLNLSDIPDDKLDQIGAIYFSQISDAEKIEAIRRALTDSGNAGAEGAGAGGAGAGGAGAGGAGAGDATPGN